MFILIAKEKHGDRYFSANTTEELADAALYLLAERFQRGYYPKPDNQPTAYKDWYKIAVRVTRARDRSIDPRSRAGRPLAYTLLLGRARHEYEYVDLVETETVKLDQVQILWENL